MSPGVLTNLRRPLCLSGTRRRTFWAGPLQSDPSRPTTTMFDYGVLSRDSTSKAAGAESFAGRVRCLRLKSLSSLSLHGTWHRSVCRQGEKDVSTAGPSCTGDPVYSRHCSVVTLEVKTHIDRPIPRRSGTGRRLIILRGARTHLSGRGSQTRTGDQRDHWRRFTWLDPRRGGRDDDHLVRVRPVHPLRRGVDSRGRLCGKLVPSVDRVVLVSRPLVSRHDYVSRYRWDPLSMGL